MNTRVFKILLIAILATLPALLSADSHEDDLLTVIQQQNERYMDAYRAGDTAAITILHTADATVIAPNFGPAKGHDEIQAGLTHELEVGDSRLILQALEVTRVADDTAYEIAQYKIRTDLPDGGVIEDEGNSVVIWQLGQDGVWRLHVDIWNTSLPLP
jgi:uncharacterized protein (TIGR02246 family)